MSPPARASSCASTIAARFFPGASSTCRTRRRTGSGIAQKGSGEVEVEGILPGAAPPRARRRRCRRWPRARPPPAIALPIGQEAGGYVAQLGAFANYANAQEFVARLANQTGPLGVEPRVRQDAGLFRVYVGPYPTREEARRAADRLRDALGLDSTVRIEPPAQ